MRRNFTKVITWIGILALCLSGGALAVEGTVFDASALRVRSETSTDSEVVGKLYEGQTVEVTGKVGDWYIIDYEGVSRYVSADYINIGDVGVQNSMGTISGSTVNVRSAPSTSSDILGRLLEGTNVSVIGIEDGWYKIKFVDLVGYVHPDYLSVNGLVLSSIATASATASTPEVNKTLAEKIVDYAYQYLGVPYVYGGESPSGFDCSGFTQYVYSHFDYSLNRTSTDQYENGVYVSYDDLAIGDLVFFSSNVKPIGHVGIYVGDGYFIHATSPGDVVRVTDLSSQYYATRYVGARRII